MNGMPLQNDKATENYACNSLSVTKQIKFQRMRSEYQLAKELLV